MKREILQRFLTNIDHTGRFIVVSKTTGKRYFVEPIEGSKIKWGDQNPATNKVEGSYGEKYKGSISRDESIITEENGFSNIRVLEVGQSPLHSIFLIDQEYENQAKK